MISSPNHYLLRGGYLGNNSLRNAGSHGYYWSSTSDGANLAYLLGFGSDYANTSYISRYDGLSVRCVAAGLITKAERKPCLSFSIIPVSYTHLDVYKRQGLNHQNIPSC